MSHVPAERCLSIIELLADGAGSMALGTISERLDLPKSGAHRLLATLVDLGWVETALLHLSSQRPAGSSRTRRPASTG